MSTVTMPVNTKQVQGRRQVHYDSLDDLLADAERYAKPDVKRLGNWSPGQIYEHLAGTMNGSIDGMDFLLPLPARVLMTLLMKRKFLKKSIPAGFKAPSSAVPDETSTEDGLASIRDAISRQKNESQRALHPAFGKLTREEWTDFHLRHAEMHMSFLIEDGDDV